MQAYCRVLVITAVAFLSFSLVSCATSNPNTFRVLTSIKVTPTSADASSYPSGQVTFTATGSFNVPPLTGPVTFSAPYNGQFIVANPTVANVVSTGTGTITVQCVAGISATVDVIASASANNGTPTTVSSQGQLTCP